MADLPAGWRVIAAPAPSDATPGLATEPTCQGEQILMPGVRPITARDRTAERYAAPLAAKKPQRPPDSGLFDLGARDQGKLL